jgi:hypothetical protein
LDEGRIAEKELILWMAGLDSFPTSQELQSFVTNRTSLESSSFYNLQSISAQRIRDRALKVWKASISPLFDDWKSRLRGRGLLKEGTGVKKLRSATARGTRATPEQQKSLTTALKGPLDTDSNGVVEGYKMIVKIFNKLYRQEFANRSKYSGGRCRGRTHTCGTLSTTPAPQGVLRNMRGA